MTGTGHEYRRSAFTAEPFRSIFRAVAALVIAHCHDQSGSFVPGATNDQCNTNRWQGQGTCPFVTYHDSDI